MNTVEEIKSIKNRLFAIENSINDLVTALRACITLRQYQELNILAQTNYESLREDLDRLVVRIDILEKDTSHF